MKTIIRMSDQDNVATVLLDVSSGTTLEGAGFSVTATEEIPYGHKIALRPIPKGTPVIKYGEVIAKAGTDIAQGQWVHVHNCDTVKGAGKK